MSNIYLFNLQQIYSKMSQTDRLLGKMWEKGQSHEFHILMILF